MNESRALRYLALAVLLVTFGLAAPAPSPALADDGNVNFFLGFKMLDEDDWEPVEDHGELGVEVSIGPGNWPIDLALDAFFSAGDEEEFGLDIDLTTQEFAAGVRKIWEAGNARPYIGGGLAIIRADAEISTPGGSVSDDDIGIGPWIGGGVFWRIGQAFNIGIAGRWSTADVEFDGGPEVDAGGLHAGLLLGWGW